MNVYRRRPIRSVPPCPARPKALPAPREQWVRWAVGLAAAGVLVLGAAMAGAVEGGKKVKVYEGKTNVDVLEESLKEGYEDAQKEAAKKEGTTNNEKKNVKKSNNRGKKNSKDPKNDPEYKEKVALSEARVKELFQKAELMFEEGSYREAGAFFFQVMQARNNKAMAKSQDLVKQATDKIIEMDGLAKQLLDNAKDANVNRDYMLEIRELGELVKQFPFAKCYDEARARLTALKNRKEVSGYVELAEADEAAAGGKLTEALATLEKIIENPRYQNSIIAMKAKRRLNELTEGDAAKERLAEEKALLAEKEAPKLLAAAKNFMLNKETARAKEKLNTIIEKYPGTKFAEEAQAKLEELP